MTAAGTPEHDVVHSGSRWEPAPVPTAAWSPPPPTPRRSSRGRRALVAVAGLACLLLGGAAGYLLGHSADGSGSSVPAGSPGPGAGSLPGGGPRDGDGGFRHHGLPGAGPRDGTGQGDGTGAGDGGTA